MSNSKPITPLVYDFDGTLTAGNLPEQSFSPAMGVTDFDALGGEVKNLAEVRDADEVLTYMGRLLEIADSKEISITRDGDTYIPTMKLVRYQGGQAIAVFDSDKWEKNTSQGKLERLIAEDRVDYVAPADFKAGSLLNVTVRGILGRIVPRKRHGVPA